MQIFGKEKSDQKRHAVAAGSHTAARMQIMQHAATSPIHNSVSAFADESATKQQSRSEQNRTTVMVLFGTSANDVFQMPIEGEIIVA